MKTLLIYYIVYKSSTININYNLCTQLIIVFAINAIRRI